MPYRPYPIADPRFGLVLSREPWLAPADAFRTLRNASVFRGRIEKRPGSQLFSRIRHRVQDYVLATGNGVQKHWDTATDSLVMPAPWTIIGADAAPSTYKITIVDPSNNQTLVGSVMEGPGDPAPGRVTLSGDGSGEYWPMQKYVDFTFTVAPANLEDILFTFEYIPVDEVSVSGEQMGYVAAHPNPNLRGFNLYPWYNPYPLGGLGTRQYKPGSLTITAGAFTVTEDPTLYLGLQALQGTALFDGTIEPASGNLAVLWTAAGPALGTPITVSYTYFKPHPCAGLERFFPEAGGEDLLAFSHRKAFRYNTTERRFIDLNPGTPTETDPMTGDRDTMQTWGIPARRDSDKADVLVVVNNTDPPLRYDPTAGTFGNHPADIKQFIGDPPAWTELAPARDITRALIAVAFKGHLIYLSPTTQDGTFRRRAWWTPANLWEIVDSDGFADAQTDEVIQSAFILRDQLYVAFTSSFWRLRWTGDSRNPFEWEQVTDGEGSIALKSSESLDETVITFAQTGPVEFNGRDAVRLADLLADFVLEVDPLNAARSHALRVRQFRQLWTAYPTVGASLPNRVLGQSLENRNVFFTFEIPSWRDFQTYAQQSTPLWDDIDTPWDQIDYSWDDEFFAAGYPIILAAGDDGNIAQLPALVYSDLGAAIEFEVETQGLNPFLVDDVPQLARLGYLHLFMDAVDGETLKIELMKDTNVLPYRTITVALDRKKTDEAKLWLRIDIGGVAAFQHVFRMTNTSGRKIAIDSIVPWFAPGGRIAA